MGWQEEYLDLIKDCENRESLLSDWERTFTDSLKDQVIDGGRPSPKQVEILDLIWEK